MPINLKTANKALDVTNQINEPNPASLLIRRLIPASPERVFRAWTNPDELKKWWGPKDVRCLSAEVDLQIGGQYRISNELADGKVLWITGEFETIERPHLLIYTWTVETELQTTERVCVQFEAHEQGTEIILKHELIPTSALRGQHQQGWFGCMDGLVEFFTE
ncbi:MAG: SRPBCC domain-containing protein [Gammaproteobacteria bacterium]|nr:SRPBCC domain-containing protein [Gammaproteobacteria bacterium]